MVKPLWIAWAAATAFKANAAEVSVRLDDALQRFGHYPGLRRQTGLSPSASSVS